MNILDAHSLSSLESSLPERLVLVSDSVQLLPVCPLFPQFDYYNSVLINERDEKGDYVELGAEFVLEPNAHFSNQLVNTSMSNVQLPTNVYNKGAPSPMPHALYLHCR